MRECLYIPVEFLDALWPEVRGYVEQALRHSAGEYHVDDIRDEAEAARVQLWAVLEDAEIVAAGATKILNYPRRRILECFLLAGEGFERWGECFTRELEGFAVHQGCHIARVTGRRGWSRRLTDYRPGCQTIDKVL